MVLDPGNFGAVTITSSITIDGAHGLGTIASIAGSAITVNAGVDDRVVLRGLNIHGKPAAVGDCAAISGNGAFTTNGVRIVQAASVVIEDSMVANTTVAGVGVAPSATAVDVTLSGVRIRNGCGSGVASDPTGAGSATVTVASTTISGLPVGMSASAGSVTAISTTIANNNAATSTTGTGAIDTSDPSNHLLDNGELPERNLTSAGGATQTWVSGLGDDANPCSRTAPCRTFAGTISKTARGGEIGILDPGSFGSLTITKAITINGSPQGSVASSTGTTNITINAPSTEDVILRGLRITSEFTGGSCTYANARSVYIASARSVTIEDSYLGGSSDNALDISPTSTPTRVAISNTKIANACGTAVNVTPAAGQQVPVLLQNSLISGSTTGVEAGTGAAVTLLRTPITYTTTPTSEAGGTITRASDTQTVTNTVTNTVTQTVTNTVVDTVTKYVEVPAEIVKVAQAPIRCGSLPASLGKGKATIVLPAVCVTTGGQMVTASVKGGGHLGETENGRTFVKATGRAPITVTFSAPESAYFLPWSVSRTYGR